MKKYTFCSKCGEKMALFHTSTYTWEADSEPYANGEQEILEDEQIYLGIYISALICSNCKLIEWMSIDDCDEEIKQVIDNIQRNKHHTTEIKEQTMKKKTWECVPSFFIQFKCPKCKASIDQGHLEDEGIENGDNFNGELECYSCGKKIKLNIQRRTI